MLFDTTYLLGFLVYYILFCGICFLLYLKKAKLISLANCYSLVIIVLILVAGFRGSSLDKDYAVYQRSFSIVSEPLAYFFDYSQWSNLEPFYYLIPSLFKFIDIPFYEISLFVFFAVIGISINLLGIKKLSNHGLGILVYFSFFFFLHGMTQIRICIAAGCLFFAVYHYYNKNYINYILIVIASFCFQYTGVLSFLILFLNRERFNLFLNLSILAVSFSLVLFQVNVIGDFLFMLKLPFTDKLLLTLKSLKQSENELNAFNVPYLLNLVITIWLFINHKKIASNNKYGNLLLKIQLISFICFGLFSSIAVIAFRLYEFFGIVSVITTTWLIYTTRYKLLAYIGIVLYCLLLMVNMLHLVKLVEPYELIF